MSEDEEYMGVMDYDTMHLKVKQALESLCAIMEDSAFTLRYRMKVLQVTRTLVEDTRKCEDLSEDQKEELGIVDEIQEVFPPEAIKVVTKDPSSLAERARKVADELEFFDEYFPTKEEARHFREWADAVDRFDEDKKCVK